MENVSERYSAEFVIYEFELRVENVQTTDVADE
jgi:hypothetical protein